MSEQVTGLDTLLGFVNTAASIRQPLILTINNVKPGNDELVTAVMELFGNDELLTGLRSIAQEFSLRQLQDDEPLFEELLQTFFRQEGPGLYAMVLTEPKDMGAAFARFLGMLFAQGESPDNMRLALEQLVRNMPVERRAFFDWGRMIANASLDRDYCREIIEFTVASVNRWSEGLRTLRNEK